MIEEDIEKIEIKSIKVPRKQSVVINNFFTIITIAIISIVIIWYVNYILPQQKQAQERLQMAIKHQQYLEAKKQQREAQIELSHKLHKKYKEKQNATK